MKPVFQNLFMDVHGKGNCLSASLASLLELSLEDVPDFVPERGSEWLEFCQGWLQPKGLTLLWIMMPETYPEKHYEDGADVRFYGLTDGVLCIGSGQSPRGNFHHAVVGKITGGWNFELVHDPHPQGKGLIGNPRYIGFIVAINPTLNRLEWDVEHEGK